MAEKGDTFDCTESECTGLLEEGRGFCATCGRKIDWEEALAKHYFKFGYHYEAILAFLCKFHDNRIRL